MTCCTLSPEAKMQMRARAGVCAVCAGDRAHCPASGEPVALHVRGKPCPRWKHPDAKGRVRWIWWWLGLPFPQRLWLWSTQFNERDMWEFVGVFPGCGCIEKLKAWTQRRF